MTNEFIFSIRNILSNDRDSILHKTKCTCFYIGPYQRGYKWMSESDDDQVPQLLKDIVEAYQQDASEYYLQYITVKADNIKNI